MTEDQLRALLEKQCPACNGSAGDAGQKMPCHECGYRGTVLTDAGRYLLGLILHHTQRITAHGYGGTEILWAGSLSQGLGGETAEYADRFTRGMLSKV